MTQEEKNLTQRQGTVDVEFIEAIQLKADFIIALCEDKMKECASFSTMYRECNTLIELMEDFKEKKYNIKTEFNEKQIRAVRGNRIINTEYWIHAELLIDGKWTQPYLVHEEKLKWYTPERSTYETSETDLKKYLACVLKNINEYLANGYELVSYEKYEEIKHRHFFPQEYEPNVVYL